MFSTPGERRPLREYGYPEPVHPLHRVREYQCEKLIQMYCTLSGFLFGTPVLRSFGRPKINA